MTFVFSALLEYALVNYASRSDAQRLARRKHQKQWELDHCAFDPEHMEDSVAAAAANNGGGSFAMVSSCLHFCSKFKPRKLCGIQTFGPILKYIL